MCRLIYVIFITSKCHHAKSQLSHRIHFQSTVELQYLRLYDELMSYCLISVQRLKILCLSLCLSPVSVCDWVFSRFRFGPSGCRQLPAANMMDGLHVLALHWHHCPSFLHDLLVSLPLIHSLSLPLLVFMLPYVFYNCFYETTHNIYRQKISWPTNEQLQHLSCRRLLTHTDTANSRAASITATYYYRQRRYHLYQLFTFTLNHHQ